MRTVTLIPGDGIGPEVIEATRQIIDATGVKITWERCEAGTEVFKKGIASGVPQETIDSILRNKVALKGPLTTPIGYGEKSANVTLRKLFETYGNIRPIREFTGVNTPYSGRNIDFVIVRENVEDLYAGMEYMDTPSTAMCFKLISEKGCEKIVRLGFELARAEGRTVVHCATKSNIMKFSEGTLKRAFERIAPEYPEIKAEHIIVDNAAHQIVKKPEQFQVIITTNMNGDILSDLGSALIGGLGYAPGANIGNEAAIFEAVHGSAPKYAGKNVINPIAVLLSGVMMLRHLGEFEAAKTIEQALLCTLSDNKVMPRDTVGDALASSTTAIRDEIIKNLGRVFTNQEMRVYKPLNYSALQQRIQPTVVKDRRLMGVDIFIEATSSAEALGQKIEQLVSASGLHLKNISSRGVQVYPLLGGNPDLGDHWRCRFVESVAGAGITEDHIYDLLKKISTKYRWMHIEKLEIFDEKQNYTKSQGEN